jgi:hypothetical protein
MPSDDKKAFDDSTTTTASSSSSSYDAFAKVDELVSKPVLGSDGAASWQNFRRDHVVASKVYSSKSEVAPKAPLKKVDRAAFTSWEEERQHENQVRKDSGHTQTGSGYTAFKKKHNAEEAAERKRRVQIEKRIRPDDQEYFIPSSTFKGWKLDYIFTTRVDRSGTGYYWDGHDSIKRLKGELKDTSSNPQDDNNTHQEGVTTKTEDLISSTKPKKKKRKQDQAPVFVSDPNNPMEQVQAILQQRSQAISIATKNHLDLSDGWESANDPTTGKTYYFHRATGQRSWEKPISQQSLNVPEKVEEKDKEKVEPQTDELLPEGWKSAVDAVSGKTYYYNTDGKTSWEKPKTS